MRQELVAVFFPGVHPALDPAVDRKIAGQRCFSSLEECLYLDEIGLVTRAFQPNPVKIPVFWGGPSLSATIAHGFFLLLIFAAALSLFFAISSFSDDMAGAVPMASTTLRKSSICT